MAEPTLIDISQMAYARVVMPDGGYYMGQILEFPGCYSVGETPAEALASLEEVAASWIASAQRQGQKIPQPLADRDDLGNFSWHSWLISHNALPDDPPRVALERHSLPGGAAGYRLVPEEPTEAMRDAFYSAWIFTKEQMPLVPAYRAMLAASPPPPDLVWLHDTNGPVTQAMETEREECAAIAYTGGAVEMPTTDFATKLDCFWAGAAEARKLVGRLIRARSTQDKTPPRPEPEETVDGRPVFIPR